MDARDQKNLQKLLASPEGKQLLRLLSQDGGAALKRAGTAVKQGDQAGAQAIMAPLLENPEVRSLLASLEKTMDHG